MTDHTKPDARLKRDASKASRRSDARREDKHSAAKHSSATSSSSASLSPRRKTSPSLPEAVAAKIKAFAKANPGARAGGAVPFSAVKKAEASPFGGKAAIREGAKEVPRPVGTPEIPDYVLPSVPLSGFAAWGLSPFFIKVLIASIILHIVAITTITFTDAGRKLWNRHQTMEVVLVNSATKTKPSKADVLAQANLDGGGNVDEDRRAMTPLPNLPEEETRQRLEKLRRENQELERKVNEAITAPPEKKPRVAELMQRKLKQTDDNRPQTVKRLHRTFETLRLEAQIQKQWDQYQKRPKKQFVGSRAEEYRFARYIENWRLKVEDIGNRNYPEAARRDRLFGSLQMTVALNKDGTVNDATIDHTSGNKILDAAALKIVDMGAPYDAFPGDIQQDTDILYITRTWTFSPEGLETRYGRIQ